MQDDEAEILALIHANRIAIWMRDYEKWAACFVHAPYTTRWGWWRKGGVFHRQGWDDIESRFRRDLLEWPDPIPDLAHDTTVENLQLRVAGDMAWATFEQHYPPGLREGFAMPALVSEMRVFERHEGHWKIAFLGFLDYSAGRSDDAVIRLGADGTALDISPAANLILADDDDVVIRAGRLRLRGATANARLQAAISWAAALDNAFMSSRGAVPIVVEAGEGLPTRIFWVIADGGHVHFSFGDVGIAEQRLDMAALIYGLSPVQKQVARLVADGLSLVEIAERLGITANTARTHLNRIFDKTGVRTQPALVRALLSAVAPL